MLFLFDKIPPYSPPTWFGITRPTLVSVPFLALIVGILYWRVRNCRTPRACHRAVLDTRGHRQHRHVVFAGRLPTRRRWSRTRRASRMRFSCCRYSCRWAPSTRRAECRRSGISRATTWRWKTACRRAPPTSKLPTSRPPSSCRRLKLLHQTTRPSPSARARQHLPGGGRESRRPSQRGLHLPVPHRPGRERAHRGAVSVPAAVAGQENSGSTEAARSKSTRGLGTRERGTLIYVPGSGGRGVAFATRLAGGGRAVPRRGCR